MRSQFFGEILHCLIHVNSDSRDGEVWRIFLSAHFHQHAGDFFFLDTNIVRQLDRGRESKFLLDCFGNNLRGPGGESRRFADVDLRAQQNREPKSFVGGGFPAVVALAAARGLMFREKNQSFSRVGRGHLQNCIVR